MTLSTFSLLLVAATTMATPVSRPSGAKATPHAEIRNVRITPPRLAVSRPRVTAAPVVTGQIRVDMSFAQQTARKPVLRLVCLCESGGELSVHTTFLDRPRTVEGMKRSEIAAAYKAAGITVPPKEREAFFTDPAKFTSHLQSVTKQAFASAVYGSAEVSRGFFRLEKSTTTPKVLLTRVEIWQNGVLVATYESSRAGLGNFSIPTNWHRFKKYQDKFKYADIR